MMGDLGPSDKILLVYIVTLLDRFIPHVNAFVSSYKRHRAGVSHDVLAVYKHPQFMYTEDPSVTRPDVNTWTLLQQQPAYAIMQQIPHLSILYPNEGFGEGCYLKVARSERYRNYQYLVCSTTYTVIETDEWLRKMMAVLQQKDVGLVGSSGSYAVGGPYSYYRHQMPDAFPNPHIRTDLFGIRRHDFLQCHFMREMVSKLDTCQMEHVGNHLTRQISAMGKRCLVVGASGRSYGPSEYYHRNGYLNGDRSELLSSDTHSREDGAGSCCNVHKCFGGVPFQLQLQLQLQQSLNDKAAQCGGMGDYSKYSVVASTERLPTINILMMPFCRNMSGGPQCVMHFASQMVRNGLHVRFIESSTPNRWLFLEHMESHSQQGDPKRPHQWVEFLPDGDSQVIVCHKQDVFMATHNRTASQAHRLQQALNDKPFLYFIQDDERLHEDGGDVAAASYSLPHFALFSTPLLAEYFEHNRLGVFSESAPAHAQSFTVHKHAIATPKPLWQSSFDLDSRTPAKRRRLMVVYARPLQRRNRFDLILGALEVLATTGEMKDYDIRGFGSQAAPVALSPGQWMTMEYASPALYLEVARQADIGIALAETPHAGVMALELAACGAISVTNEYANKTTAALRRISENLEGAHPSVEGLVAAIRRALTRVDDLDARSKAALLKDWPSDWSDEQCYGAGHARTLQAVLDRPVPDRPVLDRPVRDNPCIDAPVPVVLGELSQLRALALGPYPLHVHWGHPSHGWTDVTAQVVPRLRDSHQCLLVSNATAGMDPLPGIVKRLRFCSNDTLPDRQWEEGRVIVD